MQILLFLPSRCEKQTVSEKKKTRSIWMGRCVLFNPWQLFESLYCVCLTNFKCFSAADLNDQLKFFFSFFLFSHSLLGRITKLNYILYLLMDFNRVNLQRIWIKNCSNSLKPDVCLLNNRNRSCSWSKDLKGMKKVFFLQKCMSWGFL